MISGRSKCVILASLLILILAAMALPSGAEGPAPIRVGTYDSRLVALAYYRSGVADQAARDLRQQLDAARAAKDDKRIQELEAKGPALQNLMHQQVFGSLSIPNVLQTVSGKIPAVAAKAGVALVVSKWEILCPTAGIEWIDLTPQLVALFSIDDATRRMIDEMMKNPGEPVPVEQLLNPLD